MAATRNLDGLRSTLTGAVITPGDPGYDTARALWNGSFDRRPAVVVCCRSSADVAAAIGFAEANGLEISVRGGAHSFSGASAGDEGLTIHLGAMSSVRVDPDDRRARVRGGATWGDVDAATQEHGLAVTGGVLSDTGVGGLTLGGGMGWLANRHGLSIDNLESAEVVLADGSVVRVSESDEPDLFWALRGGGGNLGVVTEFEFRLHPVGPEVQFGLLFWEIERGVDGLRACREAAQSLPSDFGILIGGALSAPEAPFVPEEHHGKIGHALLVAGYGSAEEHADAIAAVREMCPPLFEFLTPIPYAAMQQLFDAELRPGIRMYDKGLYLAELTDDAITVMTEKATGKSDPLSFMPMFALHGAVAEVGDDATAYGGLRTPNFVVDVSGASYDPDRFIADREWARSTWDALRPLAGNAGSYVNFISELDDDDRVRASYGPAKYGRLAQIKGHYDPGNVFHRNANIKPA
ncbi:FAD/FMN-containing dehydrogenase [Pseudonocardia hierapolitana]|uniref:FAD/FMN-containing dehydrogenase n=1 Tax=Pseudonocardia hierapolitana TaxID=1128676 RepID=A0A561SPK0_9PSEU|nr:FAD-binding oxidoreductase [Pseudonocardia hierapolitana]TWF76792.1 FAD/FMN-containing dehydrogenase [Pseudonocardia hierapolitana]